MGRKKIHDEATSERLLDAAETLLQNGGVEALSAREVAAAAGETVRAIYSVFGNMDGLISCLVARGYTHLGDRLRAIVPSGDAAEDLQRVAVDGFRAFALEKPHLFRITFDRIPPTALEHEEVRRATKLSYDVLLQFIVRAQDQGVGSHLKRSEFVVAFHAMCQGMAGVELSHQAPPVGSHFWQPLNGKDTVALWHLAVSSLLNGMK